MEDKEIRQREIYRFVEHYFWDHENPLLMIRNSRLYQEGYDAYGLSDEELRQIKYQVLDKFELSPLELAELGTIFIRTGKFEFGSLAILLLKKHRPRLTREIFEIVSTWFDKGVENWSHCDLLATKILPVCLELGIATLEDFESWRTKESKWARRAAILTLIYLIRNGAEPQSLLDFTEPLIKDRERQVQQALGRFLSKLKENHPEIVEEFLHTHKTRIPRLLNGSTEPAPKPEQQKKKKKFHPRPKRAGKPDKS